MIITETIFKEATGITSPVSFAATQLGMVNTSIANSLSFIDDEKFIAQVNGNSNLSVLITTEELAGKFTGTKKIILSDDPRHSFYSLLNFLALKKYVRRENSIHPSAAIHERAYIAGHNVTVGEGVIIEPNVTILPDVCIGNHCIIRAGVVIGSEGFEHKRTKKGVLSVIHDGDVQIGNGVEIGANSCVDKGFSFRNTVIGDFTKTDNLVHIAHGVHIGRECFIAASAMLAGSVTVKDGVWIGPGASIASQVTIGEKAQITIGAVVVKDVEEGKTVSGNFAIEHKKFLRHIGGIQQGE